MIKTILSEHNLKALHIMGEAYKRSITDEEMVRQLEGLNDDTQTRIKIEVGHTLQELIHSGGIPL